MAEAKMPETNNSKELYLDLSKNATRQSILEDLLGRLSQEQRDKVLEIEHDKALAGKHYHDIGMVLEALEASSADHQAKDNAGKVYRILAEAEAQVHGCSVEETHFHEVGNGETLRSVLSICSAVSLIDPSRIVATKVQTGSGQIECAHGILDIPAPATAAILARGIPVCDEKLEGERCTPTSAAVIKHFIDVFEEGTRELGYAGISE